MYKILIIEDESEIAFLFKEAFEAEKCEVITAANGKIGVMQAAKNQPDFILLDLIMPVMNGTVALNHLKNMKETAHIPVALLTVVPEGVPQRISDPNLNQKIVAYWKKEAYTPQQIVKMTKDYLLNHPKT